MRPTFVMLIMGIILLSQIMLGTVFIIAKKMVEHSIDAITYCILEDSYAREYTNSHSDGYLVRLYFSFTSVVTCLFTSAVESFFDP